MRPWNGVVVVGLNAFKAQICVQIPRGFHVVQGVEQHAGVACLAGSIQRSFGQLAAQAKPRKALRTYKRFISAELGVSALSSGRNAQQPASAPST